jgi:hypothetical protein
LELEPDLLLLKHRACDYRPAPGLNDVLTAAEVARQLLVVAGSLARGHPLAHDHANLPICAPTGNPETSEPPALCSFLANRKAKKLKSLLEQTRAFPVPFR